MPREPILHAFNEHLHAFFFFLEGRGMLFKAEIGVCLFSSKDTAYVNWMSFGVTAFQSLDSIPGYLTTGYHGLRGVQG